MYFVHFVSAKNKQYFYNNLRNEPVGPLSFDQLRSLADMGRIGQHTWVKEKHQTEWKKLSDVLQEEEAADKAAAQALKNPGRMNFSSQAPTAPTPKSVPIPPPASDIPQPSFVRAQAKPSQKLQFQQPREPQSHAKEPIKQFVQDYIKESVKEQTTREPQKIVESLPLPKIENYDITKIQEISNTSTISGIINILVGCLWLGLGSVFAMINFAFALPPALYCIMTGVFEVAYASNLLIKQKASLKQARILAFLSIFSCFCGNLVSSILGLKNLLGYNDYRVRSFFE